MQYSQKTIDFLITWYFPYHNEIDAAPGHLLRTKDFRKLSRHYKPWFKSAGEVASYIAANPNGVGRQQAKAREPEHLHVALERGGH